MKTITIYLEDHVFNRISRISDAYGVGKSPFIVKVLQEHLKGYDETKKRLIKKEGRE